MNNFYLPEEKEPEAPAVKRLITVNKFADKNREKGSWPDSYSSIWALRRGSPANGFGKVFVKVGGRVLIDEVEFWKLVDASKETIKV